MTFCARPRKETNRQRRVSTDIKHCSWTWGRGSCDASGGNEGGVVCPFTFKALNLRVSSESSFSEGHVLHVSTAPSDKACSDTFAASGAFTTPAPTSGWNGMTCRTGPVAALPAQHVCPIAAVPITKYECGALKRLPHRVRNGAMHAASQQRSTCNINVRFYAEFVEMCNAATAVAPHAPSTQTPEGKPCHSQYV